MVRATMANAAPEGGLGSDAGEVDLAGRGPRPPWETSSLFGAHGSTPLREPFHRAEAWSCGVLASELSASWVLINELWH